MAFILQLPRRHKPRACSNPVIGQLVTVFREYGRWLRLLGVENVSELNASIAEERIRQIVLVSEALHEQRIADIALQIWGALGRARGVDRRAVLFGQDDVFPPAGGAVAGAWVASFRPGT